MRFMTHCLSVATIIALLFSMTSGKLTCAPTFRYGSNMHPTCQTCFDLYETQMFLYNYETQLCEEVTECKQPKGWTVPMIRTRATSEWAFDAVHGLNLDPEKELFAAYVSLHGISSQLISTDAERRAVVAYNVFCQCLDSDAECARYDKPGLVKVPSGQLVKFNGDPLPFGCATHSKKLLIIPSMEYLNASVISYDLQTKLCSDVIAGRVFTARICPEAAAQKHWKMALDLQAALLSHYGEISSNLSTYYASYSCPTIADNPEAASAQLLQREVAWLSEMQRVIQKSVGFSMFTVNETTVEGQYCVVKHSASVHVENAFIAGLVTPSMLLAPLEAHMSHEQFSKTISWIMSVKLAHHVECPQTSFQCANFPLVSSLNPSFHGTTSITLPAQDLDYLWVLTRQPKQEYNFISSAVRCPNYNVSLTKTQIMQPHTTSYCAELVKETSHLKITGLPEGFDYANITFSRPQALNQASFVFDFIPVEKTTDMASLNRKNVLRLSDTLALAAVDVTSQSNLANIQLQPLPTRYRIISANLANGSPCAYLARSVYRWAARSECGAVVENEEYEDSAVVEIDLTPADAPVFRMPLPTTLRIDVGSTNPTNDNVIQAVNQAVRLYIDSGYIQATSELANGSIVSARIAGNFSAASVSMPIQCLIDSRPSNFSIKLTASDYCGKQRQYDWTPTLEIGTANYLTIAQKPIIVKKLQICMNPTDQYAGYAIDIDQLKRIIAVYSRIEPEFTLYTEDNIVRSMSHALFLSQNLGSTFREHVLEFKLRTKCGNEYPIQVTMFIPGPKFNPPQNWCRSSISPEATAKFQLAVPSFITRPLADTTGRRFGIHAVVESEAVLVASLHRVIVPAARLAPTRV